MENLSNIVPSLEELNSEEAKLYLGGFVFVSVLMVFGIVGNLHVILVYGFRMKPSNHRVFILCLGLLDMTTCCVGMPFVLVDLQKPFMFFMVSACKVLRFINYFMCTASAWTLLVIAIDRYRKICVPLGKQMSVPISKALCGIVMAVSLLTSWPAPVLYGHATVETRVKNVTGVRCYTEDKFKKTKYQAYFNAILILIVFGVFFVLTVLYIIIGRQILKHKTFKSSVKSDVHSGSSDGAKTASTSGTVETPITSDDDMDAIPHDVKRKSWFKAKLDFKKSVFSPDAKQTMYVVNPSPSGKTNKSKRTTFMLFMITVVFFCSFVPHLILKIVTFINPNFIPNMTYSGKVAYNTFVWCFFINNMANPIIYGFCDTRFRDEIRNGYARIFSFFSRCF